MVQLVGIQPHTAIILIALRALRKITRDHYRSGKKRRLFLSRSAITDNEFAVIDRLQILLVGKQWDEFDCP